MMVRAIGSRGTVAIRRKLVIHRTVNARMMEEITQLKRTAIMTGKRYGFPDGRSREACGGRVGPRIRDGNRPL